MGGMNEVSGMREDEADGCLGLCPIYLLEGRTGACFICGSDKNLSPVAVKDSIVVACRACLAQRPELEELWNPNQHHTIVDHSVKDKSLIWDDCAECARKHIDAAYAALTTLGVGATMVQAEEVLLARYRIALRESESGYLGNKELAIGCLAMAELESVDQADAYREARLALTEGRAATMLLPSTRTEAWGAAHITEAFRELPALADRVSLFGMVCGGSFNFEDPPQILEQLRELSGWLVKTYELGGGK
jgi:hypothetical protein